MISLGIFKISKSPVAIGCYMVLLTAFACGLVYSANSLMADESGTSKSAPVSPLVDDDAASAADQHDQDEQHEHDGGNEHGQDRDGEEHDGNEHANDEHAQDDDHHSDDLMEQVLGRDPLISHNQDQIYLSIGSPTLTASDTIRINLPQLSPYTKEHPLWSPPESLKQFIGPITLQFTAFLFAELLAALVVGVAFIGLGRRIQAGAPPQGRFWNMLEAGVLYIRDQVARPAIGTKDATPFLPYLWTVFFFILTMNLLGMFPLIPTPTSGISVTAAFAFCTFAIVLFSGMKKLGVVGFWKAQCPHMELPFGMGYVLVPMLWCIEVFGLFIKHLVLAVRLFANMFAGHLVLAVFVGFIAVTWNGYLKYAVIPASIGGSVAISMLEVMVAFIQAYVFTFLSALFIGAAVHPH